MPLTSQRFLIQPLVLGLLSLLAFSFASVAGAARKPSARKVVKKTSRITAAQRKKLKMTVQGIEKFYKNLKDFRASFRQIYYPARFSRTMKERGRFFFKKPGRIRLQYLAPERKELIYNKRTFWKYDVDENEVQVRYGVKRSQLGVAFQFLWGGGNLSRTFRIREARPFAFGRKGDICLELVPRKRQPMFKKLYFAVKPGTFMIRETIYTDRAGNKNRFIFSKIRTNTNIPARAFNFKPPAGATVTKLP
jgi:outer membrane lipoprotein carrier protein